MEFFHKLPLKYNFCSTGTGTEHVRNAHVIKYINYQIQGQAHDWMNEWMNE